MSLSATLYSPQQAHTELMRAWEWIKAQTMAGHRLQLDVKEQKRSDKENRLLHSLLGHISKTQEWAGKKRDIETWKRLLVAAWCRLITSVCGELGIACHGISPKGKGAKVDAAEFARLTGWLASSNQHARDAAMVAFPYRRTA